MVLEVAAVLTFFISYVMLLGRKVKGYASSSDSVGSSEKFLPLRSPTEDSAQVAVAVQHMSGSFVAGSCNVTPNPESASAS